MVSSSPGWRMPGLDYNWVFIVNEDYVVTFFTNTRTEVAVATTKAR